MESGFQSAYFYENLYLHTMFWTIAEYNPVHTPRLREVFLTSRKLAFPWYDDKRLKLKDFDAVIQEEEVLVALIENNPVGFIAWWTPDNFIHSLFIDPDFTGKGIGKDLLEKCLDRLGRPAKLKVLKANSKACDFYKYQGWKVESEGVSADGPYFLLSYAE